MRDRRYKVLKNEGFNRRTLLLVRGAEAHSDDEYETETGVDGQVEEVYVVKARRGRSQKATKFVHFIDKFGREATLSDKGRKKGTM